MKPQHFETKNSRIRAAFLDLKKQHPEKLRARLNLSWSSWGFGIEPLEVSAARLRDNGLRFIELPGNHHGADVGYPGPATKKILADHGLQMSGVCGMFSSDNDLSSNRPAQRQAAIDYLRRELDFIQQMGGSYMLVVPGAVGRPAAYDSSEWERSVETLRRVGDLFIRHGVQAAIEPIRSVEVSLVHTVAEAQAYIRAVDHPGIGHINGDVYHMQSGETHIGEALLAAGKQMINVHLADSQRGALGSGGMDLDVIIMALYVLGFNQDGHYVTPEPLGPGGDPYRAMHAKPDPAALDDLVAQSVRYFHEREEALLAE